MLDRIRHYTHLTASEWMCLGEVARTSGDPHTCGEEEGWTSWSLLDFRYRRHDTAGYLFAISSFLPIVIVVFLSGLASAPSSAGRRVPALALLLCLIGSTAVNTCLKAVIRGPRPPHPAARSENYSTVHGMPSDHAQFITFFVTYLSLRARQLSHHGEEGGRKPTQATRATVAPLSLPMKLFFAVAAIGVAAGRVYNGYHTVEQVVAGAALGAALAMGCTRPLAQDALHRVVEKVMLPLMLLCTRWVCYV